MESESTIVVVLRNLFELRYRSFRRENVAIPQETFSEEDAFSVNQRCMVQYFAYE